uniref:Uncharacterized protein n=1 Tax=Rhizophora mucronata TaxID=61149 RepID=A0A2P2NS56_RHIMU
MSFVLIKKRSALLNKYNFARSKITSHHSQNVKSS